MKMLIPVILAIVGLAGGVTAGHFLKPAPDPDMMAEGGHGDPDAASVYRTGGPVNPGSR